MLGYKDLELKNDSKKHNITYDNVDITYRLSVKKTHFWIFNRDTGQEIQFINGVNILLDPDETWESFIEDFWKCILIDMR